MRVHHIDGDRTNDDEDNLLVLCADHHRLATRAGPELDRQTCKRLKRHLARAYVAQQLKGVCHAGRDERFEDGMESHFSRSLVSLIEQYGQRATEELAGLILNDQISGEVASEALRWLGLMERGPAYEPRRDALERCLSSPLTAVRDGAVLGLSFLDDPHAIAHLRAALEREKRRWLREQIREVLAQLEEGQ